MRVSGSPRPAMAEPTKKCSRHVQPHAPTTPPATPLNAAKPTAAPATTTTELAHSARMPRSKA